MSELEFSGTTSPFGFIEDSPLGRRVRHALDLINVHGGIDGAHHKQWVLDQVVRALTYDEGDSPGNPRHYQKWLAIYKAGDAGSESYEDWDEGIPP